MSKVLSEWGNLHIELKKKKEKEKIQCMSPAELEEYKIRKKKQWYRKRKKQFSS